MDKSLVPEMDLNSEIDFMDTLSDEIILRVNTLIPLSKQEEKVLKKSIKNLLNNIEYLP